jgi:DNA polymerase III subunit epsilon
METFAAIDFETANQNPDSACSIGVAIYCDGRVKARFSTLIRPPMLEFGHWQTAVHRICADDVKNKPTFQELWPKLSKMLGELPLVSHNAPFDMRVLFACLDQNKISKPNYRWVCSLELARAGLPGLSNHKLGTVAKLLGIDLDHHEAGSDAAACAEITSRLGRLLGAERITAFVREFPCCCASYSIGSASHPEESDEDSDEEAVGLIEHAIADGRFAGMQFVFTGELQTMSRADAENHVLEFGGAAGGSVSKKTNYVVVGDSVLMSMERGGHLTGKLAKAVQLQNEGSKLRIISESDFLNMLRNDEGNVTSELM